MRVKSIELLFIFLLLAGCATPALETVLPATPSEPVATQPLLTPSPTVEPTPQPTDTALPEPAPKWIALIGQNGNIRLMDRLTGRNLDITSDATGPVFANDGKTVAYRNLAWSSDGQLLAYVREVGETVEYGYIYTYELWVFQVATQTSRLLAMNQPTVGLAWRPGTHWLAFGVPFEEGYFTTRGQVDSAKARGIWAFNTDTGENVELVAPQNGYSLGNPQWSRDGRLLAFEEIWNYEGRGYFAYYDFETQEYIALNEAIGFYDWSPDNAMLVYDTLTYIARGDERIFLRPRQGGEPRQVSPDYEQGYAFWPRFSPSGEQIAYLSGMGSPEQMEYTVFVQPLAGGEPRSLGSFANGLYLTWLPDESGLILAAGPFEARQILEISVDDGATRLIAEGDVPALQP